MYYIDDGLSQDVSYSGLETLFSSSEGHDTVSIQTPPVTDSSQIHVRPVMQLRKSNDRTDTRSFLLQKDGT